MFESALVTNIILPWVVYAIFGGQKGDEGKGKLVHTILERLFGKRITKNVITSYKRIEKTSVRELLEKLDMLCVRFSGGDNAGHTMVIEDVKFDSHILPSGFIAPGCIIVIGPNCVVNLEGLKRDIENNEAKGYDDIRNRLIIDPRCVVVTDEDIQLDMDREKLKGKNKIGTTCRGIGPAYERMARRLGPFVGSPEYIEQFSEFGHICTTDDLFDMMKDTGKKYNIVMEGAQSIYLDKILGKPPYVTSGPCTPETIWTTGLPRNVKSLNWVTVMKAYYTYVGGEDIYADPKYAPYIPTLQAIADEGHEYGVTTKRRRIVTPFAKNQIKMVASRFSGIGQKVVIVINKYDILDLVAKNSDYTPYLIEEYDGSITKFDSMKDLQDSVERCFEDNGISSKNIRWSCTPHADPSVLY